jgi:hypothetical protein
MTSSSARAEGDDSDAEMDVERVKLAPLEKQVVDIKLKNTAVILFVEVGYKYRFFGPDEMPKNLIQDGVFMNWGQFFLGVLIPAVFVNKIGFPNPE